jgi:hypothetical protein
MGSESPGTQPGSKTLTQGASYLRAPNSIYELPGFLQNFKQRCIFFMDCPTDAQLLQGMESFHGKCTITVRAKECLGLFVISAHYGIVWG